MTNETTRPYLIIPRLVQQTTWGGTYIVNFKNLKDKDLLGQKIGQSYELYGKSLLSMTSDTDDPVFTDEVVTYNKTGSPPATSEVLGLEELIAKDPRAILGPAVASTTMPLLLKFTQALGNSFQLHVKKSGANGRWKPKPESWYYLEDGLITFGIKKGADLGAYKKVCLEIEAKMKELSLKVKERKMSYEQAVAESSAYIREKNPWQFVNRHRVKKHSIIDLSPGGLHHSWEEDPEKMPLGNILFEIQEDVSDDDSTIRSFDKGKMNKKGDIRPIHIEDYFTHLDTRPDRNDLALATRHRSGSSLIANPYYALDLLQLSRETELETITSFHHYFVVDGQVELESATQTISIGKGYSCFVPFATKVYSLTPTTPNAVVLKSYIK